MPVAHGTRIRPFLRHMRDLVGSQVDVSTICGMVNGRLADAFEDHLSVDTPQGTMHVRLANICWVRKSPPPTPPPRPPTRPPDPLAPPGARRLRKT